MKIPFGAMTINGKSRRLINKILDSGKVSNGKYVREFEEKFAALVKAKDAVAVSSGTDADTLALAVLYDFGAKRNDQIILPALSFVATGNSVLHAGFTPVFVDIREDTLNIDEDKIERALTARTRAILAVHLMGKPAAMDKIRAIAGKHKLVVIEDAAEAHGSIYKGKSIGSISEMTAFSFYVAHMISTIEGGIVTTNNPDYAEVLRSLRSHGRSCNCRICVMNSGALTCLKRFKGGSDKRFVFERIGYSSKMNELEAAVGLGNIEMWPEYLKRRRDNFLYLLKRLSKFEPYLTTIKEEPYERIGPHAFAVIVGRKAGFGRNELACYLASRGIDSRNMFLSMPTQCPGFAFLGYKPGQFPAAEYIADNALHIGIHQGLNKKHMQYFIDSIEKFLQSRKK